MEAHRDRSVSRGGAGAYWLSVNSVPGWDVDTIAKQAKRPNAKIRTSTVGKIEQAGWTIRETLGRRGVDGNCDVWRMAGDELRPSVEELERLVSAFGEPIENPAKIGRRRP